jgi:hypothetical protein
MVKTVCYMTTDDIISGLLPEDDGLKQGDTHQ